MESCQQIEIVIKSPPKQGQATAPNQARNRRGFSAAVVLERFGVEVLGLDRCRELLIGLLHPRGMVCGECGHRDFSGIQEATFRRFGRVQCGGCGRFFTARSGTILEGSGLNERQTVMLAAGVGLWLSSPVIAGLAQVHPETVRRWRAKLG